MDYTTEARKESKEVYDEIKDLIQNLSSSRLFFIMSMATKELSMRIADRKAEIKDI